MMDLIGFRLGKSAKGRELVLALSVKSSAVRAGLKAGAFGVAALALSPAEAQLLPPSVGGAGVQIDPGRVYGNDARRPTGADVVAGEGLSFGASLTGEWSDNMIRQNNDLPLSERYESRSDWRFSPTLFVNAGKPLGRQSLFANVVLGRDFYARNTVLDSNRFLVDAGLNWSLGTRCGGRIQGGYEDRGTRFDQFDLVLPSQQTSINFYASAGCQSPVGISPNISYDWSKTTNEVDSDDPLIRDSRDFADVEGHGITGGLSYGLAGRGDVGVQGSWRKFSYPNQVNPIGGGEPTTRITGLNGVANYRIGTSLRLNAGLGYTWVDSETGSDFSGVTWQGTLTYSGPRLGGAIGLSRQVTGSTGGVASYEIATLYSVNANYRANDRISVAAGFSRSEIDSRGNDDIIDFDTQQDYDLNRFFIGGDYRLNRRFSAGIDYSHSKRNSSVPIFDYTANSIAFSLRARF
jgi:Putative beta-barrel porin 2